VACRETLPTGTAGKDPPAGRVLYVPAADDPIHSESVAPPPHERLPHPTMNQNPTRAPQQPTRPPRAGRTAVQDGFTLIEIMVVIVILGLLATLVVPNVLGMSDEAKVGKAQTDVKSIYEAAKLYKIQNNKIPTLDELTTPDDKGKTYIEMLPQDPWDSDYIIRETDRNQFEVLSLGPDKSEGTEDDISSKPRKQ
jgi:general secretion pathway protein G